MSPGKLHSIGKLSEMEAGKGQLVAVEGVEYAVFKATDQEVYAITPTCPHQGGPLAEGCLEDYKVICPWHAWGFDIRTGSCDTVPEDRIRSYPCKIQGDEVFLEI